MFSCYLGISHMMIAGFHFQIRLSLISPLRLAASIGLLRRCFLYRQAFYADVFFFRLCFASSPVEAWRCSLRLRFLSPGFILAGLYEYCLRFLLVAAWWIFSFYSFRVSPESLLLAQRASSSAFAARLCQLCAVFAGVSSSAASLRRLRGSAEACRSASARQPP